MRKETYILVIVSIGLLLAACAYAPFATSSRETFGTVGPPPFTVRTVRDNINNYPSSSFPNVLMGITAGNDNIYNAIIDVTYYTRVQGTLTNVTYSNGKAYGTNSVHQLYFLPRYDDYGPNSWYTVNSPPNSQLGKVSFDGFNNVLFALSSIYADNIWYCIPPSNPVATPNAFRWIKVSGALLDIVVSNKKILGVNEGGYVWYCADYTVLSNDTTFGWVLVQVGKFVRQISFCGYDNIAVILTNEPGQNVYYADLNNGVANPSWIQINGHLDYVSYSGGKAWGYNAVANRNYSCANIKDTTTNNWHEVGLAPNDNAVLIQFNLEAYNGANGF
jgi:hypothetical protein